MWSSVGATPHGSRSRETRGLSPVSTPSSTDPWLSGSGSPERGDARGSSGNSDSAALRMSAHFRIRVRHLTAFSVMVDSFMWSTFGSAAVASRQESAPRRSGGRFGWVLVGWARLQWVEAPSGKSSGRDSGRFGGEDGEDFSPHHHLASAEVGGQTPCSEPCPRLGVSHGKQLRRLGDWEHRPRSEGEAVRVAVTWHRSVPSVARARAG